MLRRGKVVIQQNCFDTCYYGSYLKRGPSRNHLLGSMSNSLSAIYFPLQLSKDTIDMAVYTQSILKVIRTSPVSWIVIPHNGSWIQLKFRLSDDTQTRKYRATLTFSTNGTALEQAELQSSVYTSSIIIYESRQSSIFNASKNLRTKMTLADRKNCLKEKHDNANVLSHSEETSFNKRRVFTTTLRNLQRQEIAVRVSRQHRINIVHKTTSASL